MYPPGYVSSRNTQVCISIYRYHRYVYLSIYQHTQSVEHLSCISKICITTGDNRCNHCLVITKNSFVATQALRHMMYMMYSELLHCI